MKIILKINELSKKFSMTKRQMIHFIEKHDIYREKKESGHYIYNEKTIEEIKYILSCKK